MAPQIDVDEKLGKAEEESSAIAIESLAECLTDTRPAPIATSAMIGHCNANSGVLSPKASILKNTNSGTTGNHLKSLVVTFADSNPMSSQSAADSSGGIGGVGSSGSSGSSSASLASLLSQFSFSEVLLMEDDDDEWDDTSTSHAPRRRSSPLAASRSVSPMHPKYTHREHVFIVMLAMLLAFNSGFSNGISMSGFLTPPSALFDRQSTSGFTGVYTASALAIADFRAHDAIVGFSNIRYFGFQISMILSFIGGSCISGLLNPRPVPWRLSPSYAPTFFVGALFMVAAVVLSVFEQSAKKKSMNRFFYLVAGANGVQNGISSMYSSNLIRTTHMTGASTDIGLFLGQLIRGNPQNTWKLWILMGLALSFWTGGLVSFFCVRVWRSYSLLFNAFIFLLAFFLIVGFLVSNLHISPFTALRGTWHWQRTLHRLSLRSRTSGTPKSAAVLEQAFDSMDGDGDGFIDTDQLYDGLLRLGLQNVSKRNINRMFHVCDRDQDGLITKEDWSNLIRGENVIVG